MVAGPPLCFPGFQPGLDGLHKVSPEFIKALALADAAGQGGHLGPKPPSSALWTTARMIMAKP